MFVRVSVVALALLALTGCKKDQAAAPQASRDCCCKVCPTDAAPAAKATATAEAGESATGRRQVVRVTRPTSHRQAYRERTYAARGEALSGGDYYASGDTARRGSSDGYVTSERRYEQAEGGRYGGRYGVSGRAVSGVSVSVEESETSSERVRYRETSSGYASSSYGSSASYAAGYGQAHGYYYEDRDGRMRRSGPAGVDRAGYLTWPGKVED